MGHRTFIALDLDEAIRDRILSARRRLPAEGAKVSWVEPENLHLTLKFLGDVEDRTLADVCRGVAAAAGQIEPFEFDVRGVQAVPSRGPLRMLWVGVEDAAGSLARLYEELDVALADLRIRQENRPFKAHVTLARIKSAADPTSLRRAAEQMAGEDFGVQHADEVVCYSSQLTSDGPIYTAMARAGLGR